MSDLRDFLDEYYAALLHRYTVDGIKIHRDPVTTDIAISIYENVDSSGEFLVGIKAVTSHRVEARTGYTIKRLTAEDAAHVAELLRVSIDDKHWLAWHPKLREIREKMIERMGDIADQERTP
jgi:hypothetical protein